MRIQKFILTCLVLFLTLIGCEEVQNGNPNKIRAKKPTQISSNIYEKDKVPFLKLPVDHSFEIKKNIEGNVFYSQREKL